ncbi:hypothetical protein [Parafrankia sp. EUN1f]|uniref:hypothetical protein n=1 Tax=Parafrankia sp. EUN1f TaxID=102897 RepID=UPI0001C44E5F|nr:hypothetical protein [Parafrankia sp. EUN1f]EFC83355.1 ABC transporter related protein [Parafrankia sp. EUN1f]
MLAVHDLAVVDGLADRAGVLRHDRLVEYGDQQTVMTAPSEDCARELFLATSPVPDPVKRAERQAERPAGRRAEAGTL